jgi:hypothetical protein
MVLVALPVPISAIIKSDVCAAVSRQALLFKALEAPKQELSTEGYVFGASMSMDREGDGPEGCILT